MRDLLPLFVHLTGRRVLLVGGGPVAAAKLRQLQAVGADVLVVAPDLHDDIVGSGAATARRPFAPADLDQAWLVVAAATPEVNREVALAAEERRVFVNAVDDPPNATAFLSGVVRRDGVTVAISTSGDAPGLTGLLREALDGVLPEDLGKWMNVARAERAKWRRDGVPMDERRPLLLEALNRIYGLTTKHTENTEQPESGLSSVISVNSVVNIGSKES
jgi:siroheme synthase-like protein